jgi:tetratricopeptide (TPR) repeat protein
MLNLGTLYRETGDLSNALFYLQHVPDLMRAAGDRFGGAISLSRAGEVCCLLGQTQKSLVLCEEALSITESLPDPRTKAYALFNLSSSCFGAGEYRRAIEAAGRATALVSETGDIKGQALALYPTGRAVAFESASAEGLKYLQESALLFHRVGHRDGEANALLELARWELRLGRGPTHRWLPARTAPGQS